MGTELLTARSINSDNLPGRTIEGIHLELVAHWAAFVALPEGAPFHENAMIADMGGMNQNMPCFDSNAIVFELPAAAMRFIQDGAQHALQRHFRFIGPR